MSKLSLVLTLLLAGPAFGADEPFVDLDFDAAAAKAKADGKLLLVDFTATWCPPCKMMEKQTWPDDKVRAWVAEHAVAIQVDIDKHQDLAQRFGIQAIPTVVFLRDGTELDRHTGFRSAKDLLEWGGDVLAGKSEVRHVRVDTKALLQSDDVDKRYEAAREALGQRDYEVALQHYLWLWPNTRGRPSYTGVRLSFMLSDMSSLAKVYEPARVSFRHILDQAQVSVEEQDIPAFRDWMEWSALCREFEAQARIVTWYEETRDEHGRLLGGDPSGMPQGLILSDVFKVLVEAGRPVDAVRMYADARSASKQKVTEYWKMRGVAAVAPDGMGDEIREMYDKNLRRDLATLHAAALADGQAEQAGAVATDLLAVLDDAGSRIALVARALDLGTARPPQLATWLDEAAAKGADVSDLRARLTGAGDEAR